MRKNKEVPKHIILLRKKIDASDRKIIKTLNQRTKTAIKIQKIKKHLQLPSRDKKREKKILTALKQYNKTANGILKNKDIENIYKEIFNLQVILSGK